MLRLPLTLLAAATLSLVHASEPVRPNVVLIVVDDLGWGDVGYHGGQARTPAIDRLALEGLELDRCYALPTGRATRFAWMTGREPLHLREPGDTDVGAPMVPLAVRFLPLVLKQAGYQTALVGKWGRGQDSEGHLPRRRGYQQFYGFRGNAIDAFTHRDRSGELDWYRDEQLVEEEGYATDLLTQEALRVIRERDPARPLFLELSLNGVHGPLRAPPSEVAKYRDVPDARRQVMLAMIEAADAAVGRVLEELDSEGIANDTLVVFTSDNGGDKRMTADNQPLAGSKGSVYEGAVRVPSVLRWPGMLGSWQTEQVVWAVDWYPTLLEAAGVQPGNTGRIDGRSRWKELVSGEADRPEGVLLAFGDAALYDKRWKLIKRLRTERLELYDVFSDPSESKNLASGFPSVVAELAERLERRLIDRGRKRKRAVAVEAAARKKGAQRPENTTRSTKEPRAAQN